MKQKVESKAKTLKKSKKNMKKIINFDGKK